MDYNNIYNEMQPGKKRYSVQLLNHFKSILFNHVFLQMLKVLSLMQGVIRSLISPFKNGGNF